MNTPSVWTRFEDRLQAMNEAARDSETPVCDGHDRDDWLASHADVLVDAGKALRAVADLNGLALDEAGFTDAGLAVYHARVVVRRLDAGVSE